MPTVARLPKLLRLNHYTYPIDLCYREASDQSRSTRSREGQVTTALTLLGTLPWLIATLLAVRYGRWEARAHSTD